MTDTARAGFAPRDEVKSGGDNETSFAVFALFFAPLRETAIHMNLEF